MRTRLLSTLCLILPIASWAQTEAAPAEQEAAEPIPESILLVGQRPGPGLWKVSKGDHTLWIFGTYSPLPQKMEWRSQQVETILAQSQEYLSPPSAHAQVGFWRGLTLLPSLIGVKKNPDGATLHDVLPADVYARWQPLKAKYIGKDNSIERERPIFVAQTLYEAGLKQAGLSRGGDVLAKINSIVKDRKIKTTSTGIKLDTSNMSQALSDFKQGALSDTACFDKTLSRLESDIEAMRTRANAWAKGDIAAIQQLSYPDQEQACEDAMQNAQFVKNQPGWQNVRERIQEAWVSAAEQALSSNTTSFATLGLSDLLGPDSYLNALKAKGYQIDSPE
ncbi:TraB/GumN family protein [Duganella sp. FT80W]|uniref:TraB/GumN family protein n=1 Tax=Duganella guangzhouensis TaxID=2666084 RepID=A0A6I2L201_9BURK|nr:TraB/GumN family protein [Duganella guangzhouensis]MRW91933.1 TraB/GumN family protein [Duganella guangzhouensis]